MSIVDTFEGFAAAFEAAIGDDDWSRLRPFLAGDATYLNVGGPDPVCEGPDAIVEFLKSDVSNTDRRFDTRSIEALTAPQVDGNRLTRRWRCTYTLRDTPALVVEGEARYIIDGELIQAIEEEPAASSAQEIERWMSKYGQRLQA